MGADDFGSAQDVISIVCISKYLGNILPKPACEWSSGNKLPDSYHSVTETKAITVLHIHIPAKKEFNGDQLSCYVNVEEESSANQSQTIWRSTRFKINCEFFSNIK